MVVLYILSLVYFQDRSHPPVEVVPTIERQLIKTTIKEDPKREIKALAKAIPKIYKHLTYQQSLKIVETTFKYAKKNNIKPTLALGIIAHESSFKRTIVSSQGASGYTQVMPNVHSDKIKGRNVFDTTVNIQVGMKILGDCFKKHPKTSRALGCYNGTSNPKRIAAYHNKVIKKKTQIIKLASLQTNPKEIDYVNV